MPHKNKIKNKNRNRTMRAKPRTDKVQKGEKYKAEIYNNLSEPIYHAYINSPGFIRPGL
jgi:hypothetical protein